MVHDRKHTADVEGGAIVVEAQDIFWEKFFV